MELELEKLSYKELINLYNTKNEEIKLIEDECVKNNEPWESFVKKTYQLKTDKKLIEAEMKLKQDPVISFDIQKKIKRYELSDFIEQCKSQKLTDEDGYGKYAINNGITDIEILPSEVLLNKFRTDFPYIVWIKN